MLRIMRNTLCLCAFFLPQPLLAQDNPTIPSTNDWIEYQRNQQRINNADECSQRNGEYDADQNLCVFSDRDEAGPTDQQTEEAFAKKRADIDEAFAKRLFEILFPPK